MKKYLLLLLLLIACTKQEQPQPDNKRKTVELVVPSTFDWKTSKDIELKVSGIPDVNPLVGKTFYIKSDKGVVYFKDWLYMHENYDIKFSVPSTETRVIVVYGSKQKAIELNTNIINFDYII